MIDPVCPLRLALYGHPDSGGYWEQRCEAHVLEQGFVPCSPWRSCYFHPELGVFLIVYVDDFKMAGPTGEAMKRGWDLIRGPSKVAPEGLQTGDPEGVGRFLGCHHRVTEQWVDWHGEEPTILDPPPVKTKKIDAAPATVGAVQLGYNEINEDFLDRTYPVPRNTSVWVRYDLGSRRCKPSLPLGGPDWRDVTRRVTIDINTWEEIDDLDNPQQAAHEEIFRTIPDGPRDIVTVFFYRDYLESTIVNGHTADCAAAVYESQDDIIPAVREGKAPATYTPGRPEDTVKTKNQPVEQGTESHTPSPYVPGPKRKVTAITYDMIDFFKSCVGTYAELTDTDPETYPKSGSPYGPEMTSFEDGQGGPRGELLQPALEALAECLGIDVETGRADTPVHVGGEPLGTETKNERPPAPSGVLQPIAAKNIDENSLWSENGKARFIESSL